MGVAYSTAVGLQVGTVWITSVYSIAVAALVPVGAAASVAPPMPPSSAALAAALITILLIRLMRSSNYA
jgi:hypothetical protein